MSHESATTLVETPRPAHVPAELVHPVEHYNSEKFLDFPVAYWDDVRDRHRVIWSPYHGGFWCLTRYEDIHNAFQRPDLFSSRMQAIPGREIRMLPISLDPPEHTAYRRLLNRPLSPANMANMEPDIRALARKLIDDIEAGDGCDFVQAFAKPLPTEIFLRLLGLPAERLPEFLEWNHTILHVQDDEAGDAAKKAAGAQVGAYLAEYIEHRKVEPGTDLISDLLQAEIEGVRLSDEDVHGFAMMLFLAGLDTVTAALGWCWNFLAENPGHRQQIIDDPTLIPEAIEELLRVHSFVTDGRYIMQDCEFAGVEMKAGERIMLPTGTAGRDSHQFPDAELVDFQRSPNRHLAFAAGPHRCVGSHLARLELRVALEEWHARIPNYRLAPGTKPKFHGGGVAGPDELLLDFSQA
jgi:cytochrome P450